MNPRIAPSALALALSATLALATACSTPAAPPSDGSSQPASTTAPVATLAPPPSITATATSTAPDPATTASATASAAPSGEPAPSPSATASAAAAAPIPDVKVANIGVHVGGGPHDAATKAPIKQSVEPHFDALKRCWSLAEDQKKTGDFGIDLLIDKAGGKAKVSHPRTTVKGAGFKECMVAAFEAIDFKKPRGGTTMVSYSVRFTP